MAQPTQSRRQAWAGCPRWTRVLLILSLTLNLAGAGVLAGQYLSAMEDERDPNLSRGQARLLQLVPEDRRAEGRARFIAGRAAVEAAERQVWARSHAVVAELGRQSFAADAFAAALEGRRQAVLERQRVVQAQFVDIVAGLPAEDRAAMAARVRAFLARRFPDLARQEAEAHGASGRAGAPEAEAEDVAPAD